jgi:two-component system, OmpR family, heavy metal sensor histidine kinase CusS
MLNETDLDEPLEVSSVTPRVSSVEPVSHSRRVSGEPPRVDTGNEMTRLVFLQLALHDLQSSVAVLDVSSTLLADDLSKADPAVRSTLADIRRATFRVQQYIDHLVTSERLGPGRLHVKREQIELVPLLETVIGDYTYHARTASAVMCLDIGDSSRIGLRGDAILVRRVVQNLLENSLRHVGRGGRILIQARAASIVEVRVCNDGPPVPDELRDKIFDKFSDAANAKGATGLGLHFCKAVVTAHGGTITLENTPDWPTCFVVRLPRAMI